MLMDSIGHSMSIANTTTNLRIGEGFTGILDEVAIYGRALGRDEILEEYKRGVCNLKFQVRTGSDDPLTGTLVGYDGTDSTFFTSPGSGTFNSALVDQYFQYEAYLSTEDPRYTPELSLVSISPKHYLPTYIESATGLPLSYINSFRETTGGSHTGIIKYQISPDNGLTWYYFNNNSNWVIATKGNYSQCSTADEIDAGAAFYEEACGVPSNVKFLAYFYPDTEAAKQCEFINLSLDFAYNYLSFSSPAGEECWNTSTIQQLIWDSGGTVSNNCTIYYKTSLDNEWRTPAIVTGLDNDGSYDWKIPDIRADQKIKAWLKIEDQNDATVYGISKMFYIQPVTITIKR